MMRNMIERLKLRTKHIASMSKVDKHESKLVYTSEDINDEGYIFEYNPLQLAQRQNMIAGTHIVKTGLFHYTPRIIYDELFLELSETSQKFIIQHELGHINLHLHDEDNTRMTDKEKEADLYAAEQVGYEQSITALIEIKKMVSIMMNKSSAPIKELDDRIEHIKTMKVYIQQC